MNFDKYPLPWRAKKYPVSLTQSRWEVVDANENLIVDHLPRDIAHLIAASPVLYETIKMITDTHENNGMTYCKSISNIALSNVRGESK